MANLSYVVDRKLGAVAVNRVLDVRDQLRRAGALTPAPPGADDRPVIEGNQKLQMNRLYPAEKQPSLRYYLPQYRILTDSEGRPKVELRYREGEQGEVGRLTIDLTWTPPQPPAHGVVVREMTHSVELEMRYQLQVESDSSGGAAPPDRVEKTVPLQPLQNLGSHHARSTTVFTEKAEFDSVYQAMSKPGKNPILFLRMRAQVGVRTWRQVLVGRPAEKEQAAALEFRKALFTKVVNTPDRPSRVAEGSNMLRVRLAETEAEAPATPERPAAATFVASPAVAAALARSRVVRPAASSHRIARPAPSPIPRFGRVFTGTVFHTAAFSGAAPATASAATAATSAPAATAATMRIRDRGALSARLSRANAPQLKVAVAASDLRIDGRKAVPVELALTGKREPAVVDTTLDCESGIRFFFDPAVPLNAGVFSTEGFDSGGIHLLLALRLTGADGSTHIVYQDNLMREVVHVAPSEYRLFREDISPFLPSLCFLASDFSTTESETEAEVLFRMAVNYRLEPWIKPEIVDLARAELARHGLVARFTTSIPREARLTLDFDLLGDAQRRTEAEVDPITGITDTLELEHDTFLRLWRERLANPAGGGIDGHVDYRLFDGSPAQTQVRISLWESSAELFDLHFVGPVEGQAGGYEVLVRNRIESPVRIERLPPQELAGGVARPKDVAGTIDRPLKPGESRSIVYQVEPHDLTVDELEPFVIGRPEPDLPALLKLLMVTPGYSSLSFSIKVRAAAGAFGTAAPGAEPLTGLLVEFDDGGRVELSDEFAEAEVTLVGRLIDQILGTAEDEHRYFYRVTNLHPSGEGARTGWLERRGTEILEVGAAIVNLDF